MQRGAKTISNSHRREIENIKGNIRSSVRPFDGSGYPFKQAIKELRNEGVKITYVREKCHYVKN
ncbi:hypothetical protein [Vibrio metschnikovii]|uniref:Uncharacterized protein n=1 Tax=Vibrio metschnikovii TaxID=28172 RepID=A0A9X0REC7_VIBME|nr:hypothetical protein [Vibrio metschnikovii]MBC5853255.1 hypothetical protein [Vibrio metschnikovii]